MMKIHKHSTNTATTAEKRKYEANKQWNRKSIYKWRHVFIFFSVLYCAFASIVYDVLIKHNNNSPRNNLMLYFRMGSKWAEINMNMCLLGCCPPYKFTIKWSVKNKNKKQFLYLSEHRNYSLFPWLCYTRSTRLTHYFSREWGLGEFIREKKNGIIDMYNKYYEPLLVCYKMLLNWTSTKARESGDCLLC